MGTTLEIDLTLGTIEKRETDPELSRLNAGISQCLQRG